MTDVRPASGFRSLVQQIQENDGGADERQRPGRRRLTLPAGSRERAPAPAYEPPAPSASSMPLRLLQRRWL